MRLVLQQNTHTKYLVPESESDSARRSIIEAALEPEMPKEMDSSSIEGETQKRNMKIKSQVLDDAGIAATLAYDAFFSESDSAPMPRRIMEEVLERKILKELNWSSSEGENDDYTTGIHGRSMTTPPPQKQSKKLKSLEAPVSPPCHNARKRRCSEQKDEIKRWLEAIDDGKEKQVSTVTEAKAHSIGAFSHSFISSIVVVPFSFANLSFSFAFCLDVSNHLKGIQENHGSKINEFESRNTIRANLDKRALNKTDNESL
jgi:hypothetical protein